MLEGLTPFVDGRRYCGVKEVIDSLDYDDAKRLEGYLADRDTWTANGLSKALATKGVKLGVHTILKHRKGECSC